MDKIHLIDLLDNQIELFNVATVERKSKYALNKKSYLDLLEGGILIDTDILKAFPKNEQPCIAEMLLKKYGVTNKELTSSFYKKFSDVFNATDEQLIVDQLLHYLSTYGEIDQLKNDGDIYTPYQVEKIDETLKQFKQINKVEQKEMINLITDLVQKDIPLSGNDVLMLHDLFNYYNNKIDVSNLDIKNKELLCRVYKDLKVVPKNGSDFVRLLSYIVTNETLLIKSNEKINNIKQAINKETYFLDLDYNYKKEEIADLFNKAEQEELLIEYSKTFNRYKPFYLAFKLMKDKNVNRIINKISRLSKKYHQPMQKDILANGINMYINGEVTLDEIKDKVKDAESYKIVKLINSSLLKSNELKENEFSKVYRIRNGKSFTTSKTNTINKDKKSLISSNLLDIFKVSLLELIKRTKDQIGDKKVFLPTDVTYAVPTSTKSFVGHVPEMSYVEVENDFAVGISWSDYADIDLSAFGGITKARVSWHVQVRDANHRLLHSGDMTRPNEKGYAHESIFVNKNLLDYIVFDQVLFSSYSDNGKINAKLNISDNIDMNNYQNKENIKISLPFISESQGKVFAISTLPDENEKRKVFLTHTSIGQSIVTDTHLSENILDALNRKLESTLTIKDLLEISDIEIITDEEQRQKLIEDEVEFIDLSTNVVSKNDFLKLI